MIARGVNRGKFVIGAEAEAAFANAPAFKTRGTYVEGNKHHLYVAWSCPYANSALLVWKAKNLQSKVSVSYVVANPKGTQGWEFSENSVDPLHNKHYVHEVYAHFAPEYVGRATVPLLVDVTENVVVSKDSIEIMRILDKMSNEGPSFFPEENTPDRQQFEDVLATISSKINSGPYAGGNAKTQEDYNKAVDSYFSHLDMFEKRLEGSNYLWKNQISALDIRLFVSLIRFDSVYYHLFKLNRRHIWQYKNLWRFTCDFNDLPWVKGTQNLQLIKEHYYINFAHLNPNGTIPAGPELKLEKSFYHNANL